MIDYATEVAAQKGIDHARERNATEKSPFNPGSYCDRVYRRAMYEKESEPDRTDRSIIKKVWNLYRDNRKLRSKT